MNRLFPIFEEDEEIYITINGKDKKYKIKSILGSGTFSVVYEALDEDNTLRRIKTFNPKINDSDERISMKSFADYFNNNFLNAKYKKYKNNYDNFTKSEEKRKMCESDNKINFSRGQLKDIGLDVFIFDPQNDITLSKFLELGKDIPLQNLVHIAKSVLSYTSRIRKNKAVHFDIKPDNILINELTGDFLSLIDYGSAYKFGDDNPIEYDDYYPAISPGYINIHTDNIYYYIRGLRYCFDIFCSVKWLVDEINKRKLHINSKDAMNRLSLFVEEVMKNKYKAGEPEKLYTEMQNLLSAIDVPNWMQVKEFCSRYVSNSDTSIGKAICKSLIPKDIPEDSKDDLSLDIYNVRYAPYPLYLQCDFYEERKIISNELINYLAASYHDVIAASFTINMTLQTTREIQNAIASAITGKNSFDYLKNTLSEDNQNLFVYQSSNNNRIITPKLLLFINLRTYDRDVIEKLNLCLKELLDASTIKPQYRYNRFNYVIVYGETYCQSDSRGQFNELELDRIFYPKDNDTKINYYYEYKLFSPNKSYNIWKILNSSDKNSLMDLTKNLLRVDNNIKQKIKSICDINRLNNEIEANNNRAREVNGESTLFCTLSSFDLVISALDHLSNEKAMAFVLMLYTVYSGGVDGKAHIISKTINYHSPLEPKDIILIAERTGMIKILGVGSSNGILYITAGNKKMVDELLASAVFERYSATNFGKYYELLSEKSIDRNICDEIRMYLHRSGNDKALERFKEDFSRMDPITIKWKQGNADEEMAALTDKETFLAINLRLMLIKPNGGYEKYEEPAKETGHYVRLNKNAVNSYGITNNNEDEWNRTLQTVKNGIEQHKDEKKDKKKWAKHTIEIKYRKRAFSVAFSVAFFIAVIFLINFEKDEKQKSVSYSELSLIIGRNNTSQGLNYYYADQIIVLDDDCVFVPVKNDVLYGQYYRNFVFVDEDKQTQYETEAFSNYNISSSINIEDKKTESTLKVQYDNKTFNCVLLKLKPVDIGTEPVHITSILNRANNEVKDCDFYIVNKSNSINISIEQMPGNVKDNMEFLMRFSSPLGFTVEEPERCIYINCDNKLLTPVFVDKISESNISNENKEMIYKVRFATLNEEFGANNENVQTLRVLVDFGVAWVEKYGKKIGGINNLMLISETEKNSFAGLEEDKKEHSLCTDAEWTTKLVKSQEDIDADTVDYSFDFVINSASNSKYVIIEPPQEEWKRSYYIDNFKVLSQEGLSFSNCSPENHRYLTIENLRIDEDNENVLFLAEATVSNGNCQFADNCEISVSNLNSFLNENGTDRLGPQIKVFDYSLNSDSIYIHLKAEDDYPLSEDITKRSLQDSLFVYGAVCDLNKLDIITVSHIIEDNRYNYKKQDIIIKIPVERYLGLTENVSVMIDCTKFSDSAGNFSAADMLVIGSDAFFSAPYYSADEDNLIFADIIYPYNYKQNLTQGHIGSIGSEHNLLGTSTNENSNPYAETISFRGINNFNELYFMVNGGTGINTDDGSFLPGYICDFRSGFSVPKCRLFDGGVQAELIFSNDVDLNMLSLEGSINLMGRNGNKIKADMRSYRNGNRVLLTFTNFDEIPVTININEGIAVIQNGSTKTGRYSCRVEDYRSAGPQLQVTDYSFDDNVISIQLKEKDYPLTEKLNLQNLNDFLFVYGAVCDPDSARIMVSDMIDEDGGDVKSQDIIINIPVEKYIGSLNDVSVLIDCTKICDSKNNPSETGTLVIGSDAFFSVPYFETYNSTILADIVYPYNYFQNLTQGHIGSVGGFHNLIARDANETTKPYTRTISFKGLNSFSELYFTVNGGTGINTIDGSFLPGYRCDFRSGFSIPKCRLLDGGVQAELIFSSNIDVNMLDFEGNVELRDGSDNMIGARLSFYKNGSRVLLTFTDFEKIPETLVVKESLSATQAGNAKISEYSCSIDDKRTNNNN